MRTATPALHTFLPGPRQCPLTLQPLGIYLLSWASVDAHLLFECLPCEQLPKTSPDLALILTSVSPPWLTSPDPGQSCPQKESVLQFLWTGSFSFARPHFFLSPSLPSFLPLSCTLTGETVGATPPYLGTLWGHSEGPTHPGPCI